MNVHDLIASAEISDAIDIAGDVYMRRHYVAGYRPDQTSRDEDLKLVTDKLADVAQWGVVELSKRTSAALGRLTARVDRPQDWGVRVHEILRSDRGRDLHDHPWDFVSVLISGRYIELTPDGEQEYGPGSINARKAEDLHRLVLPDGPVVTVFMTGPKRRKWGFDAPGGWLPYDQYPDLMRLRDA